MVIKFFCKLFLSVNLLSLLSQLINFCCFVGVYTSISRGNDNQRLFFLRAVRRLIIFM